MTSMTSRARFEQATHSLAGGVDSPVRAGKSLGGPGPMISRGKGSRVVDADGREYIDYLCAYGPVFLGHAHPQITKAITRAASHGAVHGTTHPEEIRLAERIIKHMPSMQRLRFVTTGTEACMSAARVARAFARREKIVRFEGNYHGHSDGMIFSAGASSASAPALSCGVTRGVAEAIIVIPYNDIRALGAVLRRHGSEVAAVILEPVAANMGLVLPDDGYLAQLSELCRRRGVLVIFDEVITAMRLGPGGAQSMYGVQPDITCIGKVLGGGLPIAAFGGRQEIMATLAPDGRVFQGGTFSGNPVCVAAAHAFLDVMESDPGLYTRIDTLARRLAGGTQEILDTAGLPYRAVQLGSIVDFMFRPGAPHRNFTEAKEAHDAAYARYYWAMLDRGILLAPSAMEVMFLTAAHTEADVQATLGAMAQALAAS